MEALKSLSKQNLNAALRTIEKLETDKAPHSVKLRQLKGKLGSWIVNVTNKYRIIGKKESGDIFALLDIDSHDTLYNRWIK